MIRQTTSSQHVCVILLIRRRGQGEMVQYKTVICASYRDPVVMKGGGKVTYGCCHRRQTDSGNRSFEAEVSSKRSPFAESRVTALASVW